MMIAIRSRLNNIIRKNNYKSYIRCKPQKYKWHTHNDAQQQVS